jgi:hypothetical protein
MPFHPFNWHIGWCLILSGFATGAAMGLGFHRDDFWGGYTGYRRRIFRLGHIALAALGMVNVLYGLSPWPAADVWQCLPASWCFVIGGITMPAVCFLSGLATPFRHLFPIPVVALTLGVVFTLLGASP